MAVSRWASDVHGPDSVGRTTVDCLEPAAPMISMGNKILTQMADAGLPVADTRWLNAGLGGDADFAGAGYHLVLFSTTFDYLEEGAWEARSPRSWIHDRVSSLAEAYLSGAEPWL